MRFFSIAHFGDFAVKSGDCGDLRKRQIIVDLDKAVVIGSV